MLNTQNNYAVNWSLNVNSQAATQNIRNYANALVQATNALRNFNTEQAKIRGGLMGVGGGQTGGATPPAGSSQPSKGKGGGTTSRHGVVIDGGSGQSKRLTGFRQRSELTNLQKRGFRNPLSGTPLGGLMGQLLAISAVTSQAKMVTEYTNVMETARAILKVADNDLETFEDRFQNLSVNVRQIGLDTKFTAVQVADATRYLAMAGLSMEEIDDSMRPVANLATIGDEDIAKIADLATNIMTGYGISSKSMTQMADILTSTMSRSNVSITELAESFKMSAGYLSTAGVQFDEATAAIGVLGDAGMKATLAGTGLRAMVIRFAKPSRDAQATLDKLGVSFTRTVDIAGKSVNKLRPLADIFGDLKEKGASLEDLQRIFGVVGGNASLQLMSRVEKLRELTETNQMAHGMSQYVATQKEETTLGRWHQFTSALQEQFIRAFADIEPQVQMMLKNVTGLIQSERFVNGIKEIGVALTQLFEVAVKLSMFLGEHWQKIQSFLIGKFVYNQIMNVAGGVAQLNLGFGKLKGAIGGLGSATSAASGSFASMASAAMPIIATVVAGITTLVVNAQLFKQANLRAFEAIEEKTPKVVGSFDELVDKLIEIRKEARKAKQSIDDLYGWKPVSEETGIKSLSSGGRWWRSISRDQAIANFHRRGNVTKEETEEFYNKLNENFNQETMLQIRGTSNIDSQKKIEKISGIMGSFDPSDPDSPLLLQQKLELAKKSLHTSGIIDNRAYDERGLLKLDAGESEGSGNIRQTREYHELQNQWADKYIRSVVDPLIRGLSSKEDAESIIKQFFGDVEWKKLESLGMIKTDDGYTVKPAPDKSEGEEALKQYMSNMLEISEIMRGVIETPKGHIGGFTSQAIMALLFRGGFDKSLWSSTPLVTSDVNVSGKDLDGLSDAGGAGNTSSIRRQTAQPRQVIVNIDNMMRVDRVDINEENKGEVMGDLKEQLTQILLDVVHDFSASYHG